MRRIILWLIKVNLGRLSDKIKISESSEALFT